MSLVLVCIEQMMTLLEIAVLEQKVFVCSVASEQQPDEDDSLDAFAHLPSSL